jgi:caa(3)-type oxidase subunit IV
MELIRPPAHSAREIWRGALPVWAVLMALVFVNLALAYVPMGVGWNTALSLLIAAAMAGLIFVFFMQLRHANPLLRLAAATALIYLSFMFVLILAEILWRPSLGHPGTVTPKTWEDAPATGVRIF